MVLNRVRNTDRASDDRGVVLVISALALVTLLGIAAFITGEVNVTRNIDTLLHSCQLSGKV